MPILRQWLDQHPVDEATSISIRRWIKAGGAPESSLFQLEKVRGVAAN